MKHLNRKDNEAYAVAKNMRVSPSKANLVLEMIRGKKASDAINVLKVRGFDINGIKISATNAVDLGFGSENEIYSYADAGCQSCKDDVAPLATYTLPFIDSDVIEALGPNFNLETNYKLDNVSRPLLRTNPKLTTNIKLVVNESDNLYLESINATKELA